MLWGQKIKQGEGLGVWAESGVAILSRVLRNSFTEKVTLISDLKEVRKLAIWFSELKEFQKEENANAKIRRQE